MNLDAAIRLSASVTGANNIRALQTGMQGLNEATRLSRADLGRWNIEINRAASEAGNTVVGLRAHATALQRLRERVDIGSNAYQRLGREIATVQGRLKQLQAEDLSITLTTGAGGGAGGSAAAAIAGAAAGAAAVQASAPRSAAALRLLDAGFQETRMSAEQFNRELNQGPSSSTLGMENHIRRLSNELQHLKVQSQEYEYTLARIRELETVQSFRVNRANVIAQNNIFNDPTMYRGWGSDVRLQPLPNSIAADNQLVAELTQRMENLTRGTQRYTAARRELALVQQRLSMDDNDNGLGLAALGGRAAAGAAAIAAAGFAAAPAVQAGIDREESERRLRILSDGFDEYRRVQDAATLAAERFGVSQTEANRSFGQLYARLRPMGFELTTLQSAYNGFNTAAKLSGATSVEASAAFLQLSQALGSGVLRGEELNSVYEQTPAVIQAIAKEMDIPIGQLRAYAKEGKITSDIVLAALARIEAEGAGNLAEAMEGPRQQVVNLQNAFQDLQVAASGAVMPAIIAAIKELTESIQAAEEYAAGLKVAFEALRPAVEIFSGINRGLDEAIKKFPQLANVIWTAVGTFLPGLQQTAAIISAIRSMGRGELGRGDGDWNALPAGAWPEGVPMPGTSREEAARQAELRRISREGAAAAAAGRAAAGSAGGGAGSKAKTPSDAEVNRQELERIRRLPFGRDIIAAAEANNLDPRLFAALVQQESNFRPGAVSRSGAIGLAQLMPGTSRELGVDPRDPRQNLLGGARYLRQQIDRFGLEGGLRAYNQGPGAQQRTPGGNSAESRAYPGAVLARARAFGFDGDGSAEDMKAAAARADALVDLQKAIAGEREKLAQLQGQVRVLGETDELTRLNLEYQEKQRAFLVETQARISEVTDQELVRLMNAQAQEQYTIMQLEYSRELIALEEKRTEELTKQNQQLFEASEAAWEFARARSEGLDSRAGVGDGITSYMESVGTLRDSVADLTVNGFTALEDVIVELATTARTSFREMAAAIMKDTARMIIQQLVMAQVLRMVQNLMGFGGAGGSGLGQALGGPLLSGISNVGFNPIAFTPGLSFNGGGIADGPRSGYPAMLHGTEAVVPLADGRSIPVRMQGGGGGTSVVVNVDAKGTRAEGDPGRAAQVGRELGQFVEQKILEMRRPGGLLAS